ncbi:hypothetical protein [Nocardia panacis]|uniref:hypothetical protein n=1 Tax=Nocardia panacis TaxID=2340916 RepID=UPI0013157C41|nr:hypothetical protein [Nocardia panacis]
MSASPTSPERHAWTSQQCGDTWITGLDHARVVLTVHGGHGPGCNAYLAALGRASSVCQ